MHKKPIHPWKGQRLFKLEGTKQHLWSVLNFVETRKKAGKPLHIYWCRCDCGKEREVSASGSKLTSKCCGCYKPNMSNSKKRKSADMSKVDVYNQIRSRYKREAKQRGYVWELNKEQFHKLVTGNCFYCEKEYTKSNRTTYNKEWSVLYNGIDRVDNTKGYTLDNCVSCCGDCNTLKKAVTPNIIKKAYKFIFEEKRG